MLLVHVIRAVHIAVAAFFLLLLFCDLVASLPQLPAEIAASIGDDDVMRHSHHHHHRPRPSSSSLSSPSSPPSPPSPSKPISENVIEDRFDSIDGHDNVDVDDDNDDDRAPTTDQPFAGCDFYQTLQPNKSYDIFAPGPARSASGNGNASAYEPDTQCRWMTVAPENHFIRLQCVDIAIPTVCF